MGGRLLSQEEFMTFLWNLALECTNHVHVCEKQNESGERFLVFYVCINGQPSGNPDTAPSNTEGGKWILVYVFLDRVCPVTNYMVSDMDTHVYTITYGDDVVINISDEIAEVFNQHVLTEAMMDLFQLECTDEKKTGELPPKYRSLSEVTFLKRSFIWNDDICMYVGALPVDLLYDITNWVKDGPIDPHVMTVDNLVTVSRELALHGREVYERELPKIKQAYSKIAMKSGKYVCFDSYWSHIFKFRNHGLDCTFDF